MKIKTCEAIVKCLEEENVEVLFGYPGGAVLPLYESLRSSNIEHILVRQEQSAAHMASGYSRASGKVGVCIATSGPGATNLITGIATAYMDSIPLIAITGQVSSEMIGRDTFQEADINGASEPFTKHNYLVKNADELPRIMKEAFYIANTGRKGPVLIDIPRDIQDQLISYTYPKEITIRGYKPTYNGNTRQIDKAVKYINNAKKPIVCVGGGITSSNAKKELMEFIEKTKIPVVCSLMGIDAFPNDSEYFSGLLGSHGYPYVNRSIHESDLLIVIGARFADRSTSMLSKEKITQNVIHIDIDPAEIGKNISTRIPIVGDAKNILSSLLENDFTLDTHEWLKSIKEKRIKYRERILQKTNDGDINPRRLVKMISEAMNENGILTADVGLNQIWAAHCFNANNNRKFLTSGGLGTMGYSIPAAIGAKFASTEADVVAVVGDGGFQMLLGELAVISEYNLNVKIIVFNNNQLGMVKELQDNAYGKEYNYGVKIGFNPDFIKLADAYGIEGIQISKENEMENAIEKIFKNNKPFLLECIINPDFPSTPRLGGR